MASPIKKEPTTTERYRKFRQKGKSAKDALRLAKQLGRIKKIKRRSPISSTGEALERIKSAESVDKKIVLTLRKLASGPVFARGAVRRARNELVSNRPEIQRQIIDLVLHEEFDVHKMKRISKEMKKVKGREKDFAELVLNSVIPNFDDLPERQRRYLITVGANNVIGLHGWLGMNAKYKTYLETVQKQLPAWQKSQSPASIEAMEEYIFYMSYLLKILRKPENIIYALNKIREKIERTERKK